MFAPAHVCQALFQKNKQLRFAWWGKHDPRSTELNQGTFAVVRLYPTRALKDTAKELWDRTLRMNNVGGFYWDRDEKGPIFNAHGGTDPDWDVLSRCPVIEILANRQFKMSHRDVYSGALASWSQVVSNVEHKRDRAKFLRKEGQALQAKADDVAQASLDHIYYEANKASEPSVIMANKHVREEYGNVAGLAEKRSDENRLDDLFVKSQLLESYS